MKTIDYILLVVLLSLVMKAGADLDNSAPTDDAFSQTNQMTWPMLPGESIAALADKFYPKNRAMQQRFITKTLRLNKDDLPDIQAQTLFDGATPIVIPTLKSLARTSSATQPHRRVKQKHLTMSYQLAAPASPAITKEALPKKLADDYEQLLRRNERLKTQISQLNAQLLVLQQQATQLQLPLEKSLQMQQQAASRPALTPAAQQKVVAPRSPQADAALVAEQAKPAYWWVIALVALGLLAWFSLMRYEKKRALLKAQLLNANEVVMTNSPIEATFQAIAVPDMVQNAKLFNDDAIQMDAHKEQAILEEARILVKRDALPEAIEHLKWAISNKPRIMINVWLYLLDLFRQTQMRDDFEKYAFELHQQFNVMTPLWDEQEVEMVISETLEDFSHITQLLSELWPSDDSKYYLQSLIADNRNGERVGFSQTVVDEMLLLIAIQALRSQSAA